MNDQELIRLYYYTAKPWAMKILWERRLKIAQYKDLGDPFELMPFDRSSRADRKRWDEAARQLMASDHGVVCFSEDWRIPILWSTYADKQTGMCLGFDIPRAFAGAVTYIDEPLMAPGPGRRADSSALESAVLRFKPGTWRHEREWRVRAPLTNAHDGLYYLPFDGGMELREVILGPRCSLLPEHVLEAVHSPPLDVDIFASRSAWNRFEVERHEVIAGHTVTGFRDALTRAEDAYVGIFDTLD